MPRSGFRSIIGGILANAGSATSHAHAGLERLVRAHAPAHLSTLDASLHPGLDLRSDLGFDVIALAELAVAIEDAFGTDLDIRMLADCRTIRDLECLIAAGGA